MPPTYYASSHVVCSAGAHNVLRDVAAVSRLAVVIGDDRDRHLM